MKKLKSSIFNRILIFFMTFLVVLNSIVPSFVLAEEIDIQSDEWYEFALIMLDGREDIVETRKGDSEWIKKYKDVFLGEYKDFNSTYPAFEGKKTQALGSTGQQITGAYKKYINEKKKKWDEYKAKLAEDGKDVSNIPNAGKTEEELKQEIAERNEKAKEVLVDEKEQWDFMGSIFSHICNFVCGLGDMLMNLIQGMMLPASPTAVAKRKNSEEMKTILDKRDDTSFICAFYYIPVGGTTGDNQDALQKNYSEGTSSVVPVPFIYYSPLAIFSNKVPALDVNFLASEGSFITNPFVENEKRIAETRELLRTTELKENAGDKDEEKIDANVDKAIANEKKGNTAYTLKGIISQWYVALRNIAVVGLMIVLVYIGIRILIASTGEEAAKYKTMLKDWAMAIVLVFVIHYIMVFMLTIMQNLINMFTTDVDFMNGDDLLNKIRMNISLMYRRNNYLEQFGYALIYLTIIWYTVIFTWQYIKRAIYMAFLTVIAPLVALTYPIDKIKDGKSQAFNMWLKEYMFNLLLQPIHLLLYTILVTSAVELVSTNIIYALVAIGFILQAEKFIKKLFGMQAEGGSMAGSFASGAAFSAMMNQMQKGASGVSNALGANEKDGSGGGDNGKVRTQEIERKPDKNAQDMITGIDGINGMDDVPTPYGLNTPKTRTKDILSLLSGRAGNAQNIGGTGNLGTMGNIKGIGPRGLGSSLRGMPRKTASNLSGRTNTSAMNNGTTPYIGKSDNVGKRFIRGARRVGRRYVNLKNAKSLTKLAAMGLIGASAGMIGIAGGLASDDYKNVLSMGAMGLGAGALLGKEAFKQGGAVLNEIDGVKEDALKGWYGKEYKEKVQNPKEDLKFKYSADTTEWLMTKYGANWKDKQKQAMELRKVIGSDRDLIEKAIKINDEHPELGLENSGLTAKTLSLAENGQLMKEKGHEAIDNSLMKLTGGDEKTANYVKKIICKQVEAPYKEVNTENVIKGIADTTTNTEKTKHKPKRKDTPSTPPEGENQPPIPGGENPPPKPGGPRLV